MWEVLVGGEVAYRLDSAAELAWWQAAQVAERDGRPVGVRSPDGRCWTVTAGLPVADAELAG